MESSFPGFSAAGPAEKGPAIGSGFMQYSVGLTDTGSRIRQLKSWIPVMLMHTLDNLKLHHPVSVFSSVKWGWLLSLSHKVVTAK